VVEENTGACPRVVAFTVILRYVMAEYFSDAIRRAWMELRRLSLRRLVRCAEHL
jgi:hypothetical protein